MLLTLHRRNSMLGIGLLELMLSLAIISVLLVMATRYFRTARQGQQVNAAISQTQAIIAASANWIIGHDDYSRISVDALIKTGLLPDDNRFDPWNGPVKVHVASSNPNQITIEMGNLPYAACRDFASRIVKVSAYPNANSAAFCQGSGQQVKFAADF